jgi:hypothetical protein
MPGFKEERVSKTVHFPWEILPVIDVVIPVIH